MGLAASAVTRFWGMPALESTVDMYDLRMSEGVRPLYAAGKTFIP